MYRDLNNKKMAKKFGLIGREENGQAKVIHPKYARFRCVVRFRGKRANGHPYYAGYDIQPTWVNGKLVYYRDEAIAWHKLMEMIRKLKPWEYYAASIFVNLTNDLRWEIDGKLSMKYEHRLITVHADVHKPDSGIGEGGKPIIPLFEPYQSQRYTAKECVKIDVKDTLRRIHWREEQHKLSMINFLTNNKQNGEQQ